MIAFFVEMKGRKKSERDVTIMPCWSSVQTLRHFVAVFYEINLCVVFDWISWSEGERLLNKKSLDYTTLDTVTLCKLLTAVVRADRFNDGLLIANFKNGVVPKIIPAIKHNKTRKIRNNE